MKFFTAVDEEGTELLYALGVELIAKDDMVVVPSFYDEMGYPLIVKVTNIVSELNALTSRRSPIEAIQKIDMSEHNKREKKKKENAILLDKMQSKVSEIKMLEQLKKFAGMDSEMASLLAEYNRTHGTSAEEDTNS